MKKRLISFALTFVMLVNVLASICFSKGENLPVNVGRGGELIQAQYQLKGAAPRQEYYNSQELGYVPGVKDQKTTELCWAFTQNNLIESYLLRTSGQEVDLSEQTMKFETSVNTNPAMGYERNPNGAGNEYISLAYLARGGSTFERDEVFSLSEKREVQPELLEYHGVLTGAPVLSFSDAQHILAIDTIKRFVYDYGAVGAAMYYANEYELYRYEDLYRTCYNYTGGEGFTNHEVTIIGWDDNYSRENFVQKPVANGAFIVKNSWGNCHNAGTNDILYVSYYDKMIWREIFATSYEMENDIYDNAYQYDMQGYTDKYQFEGDRDMLYATRYKKTSPGQSLCAASTFVTDPGVKIEVFANVKNGNVNSKTDYVKVYEKTFDYAGYYLMEFDGIEITGDEFCVAIKVTNPYGAVAFPVCQNGAYLKTASAKKKSCYITGGDFGSFYALETVSTYNTLKTVVTMKAFTKNVPFEMADTSRLFNDIKAGDWFKVHTDFAVTYDIFNGTSQTAFSPYGSLTRAQFVQVLANISGVDTVDSDVKTAFSDVKSGAWYTAAVKWASDKKIVAGMGDGRFCPDKQITREEMCVMLINYINECLFLYIPESTQKFADDPQISSWARSAVYKCKMASLVSGVGDNKFAPKKTANRAEGATLFAQFYKRYFLV